MQFAHRGSILFFVLGNYPDTKYSYIFDHYFSISLPIKIFKEHFFEFDFTETNKNNLFINYKIIARKKSQRNLNIKNYNKVLNNLRIKFKGNIHITRKSKGALSIISYQKNAGIKNFNEFIRNSANLNDDKSYENTNISRYEHICSFSNEMIKESLYENKVENIYKNINIKCK